MFDDMMRPLSGAEVKVGELTTTTDEKGRYAFASAPRAERIVVRASKPDHWAQAAAFMPTESNGQGQHVMLRRRRDPPTFNATEGGTFGARGLQMTLSPGAVQTADGRPYTGTAALYMDGATPAQDEEFGLKTPGGDFLAINAEGQERFLYSYGFVTAELTTPTGEPLRLNPAIGA